MDNAFLKVADVAELLQLSPRQILNLCNKDKAHTPLPHMRVNGRSLRFRKSDVDAWFSKHLVNVV